MAGLTAILPVISAVSTVLSFVSGMKQASIAEQQARTNAQIAAFEATQYEQQAKEEQAVAQRKAQEDLRKGRLLQSRALAVAAASGAGASDPTVVKIISDLAGEGRYQAGLDLYEGESAARKYRLAAQSRRYEGAAGINIGENTASALRFGAGTTLLTGIGSLYGKYGTMKKKTDTTLFPELPGLGDYS